LLAAAAFGALTAGAGRAHAHDVKAGDLVLDHAYATPSLAGASSGAAYLKSIRDRGDKPDRLTGASSPVAARVELHRLTLVDGVMRMREVPFIELPARAQTPLRHGGDYQLKLVDLKQPLKDGDRFELTLNFQNVGRQTLKVWVQTPRDSASSGHRH